MTPENNSIICFTAYEDANLGILTGVSYLKIQGSVNNIERLIAFALQSDMNIEGLTEGEREKLLALELKI